MKKVLVLGLALALLCVALPPSAQAGVSGSRHDMTLAPSPQYDTLAAFADYGACSACHVPHGAQGARLFPNVPVGGAGGFFGPLCQTCHAISVINDVNINTDNTVMNLAHGLDPDQLTLAGDDHQIVATSNLPYTSGDAPSPDPNDIECLSCHDVHNTASNFRPFLQVALDTLCESCHTNRVNAATATTGTANAFGGGSTHPAGTAFNGDVSGIASAGAGGDSPFVAGWGTEYVPTNTGEAGGSEWIDPNWDSGLQLEAQGAAGTASIDCISCHNVHHDEDDTGAWVTDPYLGIVAEDQGTAGQNNDFCEYCHQGANVAASAGGYFWNPGNTAFSHPNDDVAAADPSVTANTAWMGALGTTSATVGTAASGLVCTSCHGIHPQNATTPETEANSPILLNHAQASPMNICTECHSFAGLGFNHHPVGGSYATAGNTPGGVTCGGGDLAPGIGTCHSASGSNGSVAHNRTAPLGSPSTGAWGAGYMCTQCHTVNPSVYTTTTPYTAAGEASHFVGETTAALWTNGRTTDNGSGGIQSAGSGGNWTGSGLPSLFQDGGVAGNVLVCESCHRLANGNIQDGDGATMMLVEVSGADNSTVAVPAVPSAADYTGAPYLCTGCHFVPGGTHPLLLAGGSTAYVIGGNAEGQTYTTADNMNCESCHSPHDAETSSGSYILDGAAAGATDYGAGAGMDVEPIIDYTTFCAVCHGAFQ